MALRSKAKHTKAQREARLARTAEFYAKGWPALRIAGELGVSERTVRYDLAELSKRWQEEMLQDTDKRKADILHELQAVKREAWKGWDRSLQPTKTRTSNMIKSDDENARARPRLAQIKEEDGTGDPRFLTTIERVIGREIEILGLVNRDGDGDGDTRGYIVVVPEKAGSIDEWRQKYSQTQH